MAIGVMRRCIQERLQMPADHAGQHAVFGDAGLIPGKVGHTDDEVVGEPRRDQRPMSRRRERTKSTTTYSPRRSGAAMKARPWLMRAMSSTKPTR